MASSSLADTVRRAQAGDPHAKRALVSQHQSAAFGYCLAFARGDRPTALDLCQDSFLAAFESLSSLRDPERFSGWMRQITRRTCLQWAARRRRERVAMARLEREPMVPATDRETPRQIVQEVVRACPDEALRRVAELYYLPPPHSTEQIGQELGMTKTAVSTRLLRFRRWARRRMLSRLAEAWEAS